jgi:SnoaL-like protein
MMSRIENEARAREWAARLDQESFAFLPSLMSEDCEYQAPSGLLKGAEAIVASYRRNAEWAHRTFEHIEWSSEVVAESAATFLITFEDRTLHQGIRHRYRCRQRIRFDGEGRVNSITHLPIPGEDEALAAFFARIGVER